MSTDRDLTEGSVARALIGVSAPMTLGILGVLSVGLADAFFLARDGEAALAAIGFIYPVITVMTSLSIGLGAGTNTIVSQAIGKGAQGASRMRLTIHAMILAAGLSGILALFFYLSAPWIFSAMGAKGAVLEETLRYVPYWCLSFPSMVTGMALNAVFRAAGQAKVAATMMVAQSLINVVLDPILIFGLGPVPALGIEGAGLATLVARMLGFAGLVIFAMKVGALRFDCAPFRCLWSSLRSIGRVGAPAALSNAINPAGMAAVTAAVAIIGDSAVAGFGAAGRVQSLLLVPMLALSSGIGPVVGQAWGAGMQERAQEALRLSFLICIGIGLGLAVVLTIWAEPIAAVMTGGDRAAGYAASYLRVASWGFFGFGVLITANAAMNARDRAVWSMGLSAGRIFLIYVPLSWFGVWVAGYNGMLVATVLANVIGAWAALVACRAVSLFGNDWRWVSGPAARLGRAAN